MEHLQQLWSSSAAVRVVAVGLGLVLLLALFVPDHSAPPPTAAPPAASDTPLDKAKAWLPKKPSPLPMQLPGKVSDTMNNELERIDETGRLVHEGVNAGARVATGVADALLDTLPAPAPDAPSQP